MDRHIFLAIFLFVFLPTFVLSAPKDLGLKKNTNNVQFKDCPGQETTSKVTSVKTNQITKDGTPQLKKGTNATFEVDFDSGETTGELKSVVHGIIGGFPVPFTPPNPDGCHDSGITCPINKGSKYAFQSVIPILSAYPKVKVVVKWELQDSSKKDVFCIVMPAVIVD